MAATHECPAMADRERYCPVCDDGGDGIDTHNSGMDCDCPACADKPRCPNCDRDFEGCECSASVGGIGHDAHRKGDHG